MVHYFYRSLILILLSIATTLTQSQPNRSNDSRILDLTANPPLVTNCSKVELICKITSNSFSNLNIWWTFRNENISAFSDIIESYTPSTNQSKLTIECASVQHHNGSYACNVHQINGSELIFRNETNVKIFVPVRMNVMPTNGTVTESVDSKAKLICKVSAYPKTIIKWEKMVKNESLAIEDDGRIISEFHELDETTQQSILSIESLKRSDNGTYVCKATNEYNNSESLINLIVFETPEIHFDRIQILNTRKAIAYWSLAYNGNLPINSIQLEIRNYSIPDSDWIIKEENIVMNTSQAFIVQDLTPGATYGFRLAAINLFGRSEWEFMNTTMPADVPSKITEVHVLAKTNETLLIGWKRPAFDNGAQISQYQMNIRDTNDILVSNQTLDISSNSVQTRNKHMIMFPSLQPGSHYSFEVRACSAIGCGQWSNNLDAVTADGHSDAPRNVRMKCYYDINKNLNNASVSWDAPDNVRGSIVGFNVSLEGFSSFRNADNKIVLDQFKEAYEVLGNETYELNVIIKANTNYTVRLCTINKSGCGLLSHITTSTMCQSTATTPSTFPSDIKLEKWKPEDQSSRHLRLFLPRISERNGAIKCYKVIIIRLPKNLNASDILPSNPNQLNITTYSQTHSNFDEHSIGAYVAEEFNSDNFIDHIVIGDGNSNKCNFDDDNRSPRRISNENESALSLSTNPINDGTLQPNTNYTAFIEVSVLGPNNSIIVKQSPYLEPIETTSISLITPELSETSFSLFFSSLSDSANGILFGTICGLLLVLVLLSSVLCFLKRKANETSSSDDERMGLTSLIRRTVGGHRNGHIPNHINLNSVNSIQKWVSAAIPIHNLPTIFQERHANSDFLFQGEFEALPEKFSDRTTIASDSPENMGKNRYPDIKSYDQTRVKLSLIDDIPGSDYINADFVQGYKQRKLFICAQGPIQKTIVDFWRMIYEQKCSVIVMLTGIEEQGRIKCSQYWSEDQPKEISNLYKVTLKSVRKYSDYITRRFILETLDGSEIRDILQFHFVMWKDFLAPEQPSWLLRFIKRVNEHYCPDKGPLLVHCSAGVGRTGTFIAIDSLIPEMNENATHINIFECVSQLRHQRNYLVQSIKQYIFVYRAVMEFAEFGDTEIEICHLRDHYRQLKDHKYEGNVSGIMAEFERLNEVIEDPKSCVVGTMDMNRNKNRYDFIIPYDINRVILTPSPAKDHCYYINASFVQGYDHSLSFIVTQDPLEHTVNEFWWMIAEQNVSTLVMLAELGDGQSKCHFYWPTEEFDCEFVKVKFVQEDVSQYYIKRVFDVTQKKSNDCQTVTQFQFLSWKNGVLPESTKSLINLIDVSMANNTSSISPIVVHCSGGGDRSSVFVAFATLIQQIKCEERVDVFQTARYTRSQRHCMLQTIAQYDFLYRSLIDYIESHNLCDTGGDTQL